MIQIGLALNPNRFIGMMFSALCLLASTASLAAAEHDSVYGMELEVTDPHTKTYFPLDLRNTNEFLQHVFPEVANSLLLAIEEKAKVIVQDPAALSSSGSSVGEGESASAVSVLVNRGSSLGQARLYEEIIEILKAVPGPTLMENGVTLALGKPESPKDRSGPQILLKPEWREKFSWYNDSNLAAVIEIGHSKPLPRAEFLATTKEALSRFGFNSELGTNLESVSEVRFHLNHSFTVSSDAEFRSAVKALEQHNINLAYRLYKHTPSAEYLESYVGRKNFRPPDRYRTDFLCDVRGKGIVSLRTERATESPLDGKKYFYYEQRLLLDPLSQSIANVDAVFSQRSLQASSQPLDNILGDEGFIRHLKKSHNPARTLGLLKTVHVHSTMIDVSLAALSPEIQALPSLLREVFEDRNSHTYLARLLSDLLYFRVHFDERSPLANTYSRELIEIGKQYSSARFSLVNMLLDPSMDSESKREVLEIFESGMRFSLAKDYADRALLERATDIYRNTHSIIGGACRALRP